MLALAAAFLLCIVCARAGDSHKHSDQETKHQRLPRPQLLGKDLVLERDPATQELHSEAADSASNSPVGAIRSHVTLVQVPCTVTASDGTEVRGLKQADFRLFEDGTAQQIASFDAAATPASIALILDVSPSMYRELSETRDAARAFADNVSAEDEVAVVSFSSQTHLLLPFTRDRGLLDRAIDSRYLATVENSSESRIYESVFFAAHELFSGRTGRKAIVLLTDGQDSGLGLTWDPLSMRPSAGRESQRLVFDDVARELGGSGIALFIVSTENRPREMTAQWIDAHRNETLITGEAHRENFPLYTLYLAELARRAGGQLYFLRESSNLADIYRRIALAISAQYTLGYYPSAGTSRPGWRALQVTLSPGAAPPGLRLTYRTSYYVSAFQ
jgi:Ca-activated chloride channel family protein